MKHFFLLMICIYISLISFGQTNNDYVKFGQSTETITQTILKCIEKNETIHSIYSNTLLFLIIIITKQ